MPNKNEPSAKERGPPQPRLIELTDAQREMMLAKRNTGAGEWLAEGIRLGVAASRRDWLIFVASKPTEEHAELLKLTHCAEWLPQPPACILPPPSRLQ